MTESNEQRDPHEILHKKWRERHPLPDPHLVLGHARESQTISFSRRAFGRIGWSATIDSEDPRGDDFDTAFVRLDDLNIRRLLHWLTTGEAAPINATNLPDLPEIWRTDDGADS